MDLNVNGKTVSLEVPGDMPLLWALRDTLGYTGTKYGCGMSLCGACTIFLDNEPVRSCVTPVSSAVGKEVKTIEGINGRITEAVKLAWQKLSVPQCGYCQSGQIMSATALLTKNKNPNESEIKSAMSGNICRCGTYLQIQQAIQEAARSLL
jgi:isoquinoline 1-oxidoreductase alpha subunit